jgi:hypothetical protein
MTSAPSREGVVYLALEGETGPIFSTSDGGTTWSEAGQLGDERGYVRDLRVHPRDERIVYALAQSGLFISRNGGIDWEDYNEGIGPGEIDFYHLVLDSTANKIFAGGGPGQFHGSANIYYRDLEPVGVEGGESDGISVPHTFHLSQNFPNPFNPLTTIAFAVPDGPGGRHMVDLAVYDIRGRHVRTLLHHPMPPGSHMAVWNGRDDRGEAVPSGIYLYRLKVGSHSATRKMTAVE